MTLSETGLSYRRSAIQGASAIGLIITLLDTLVGNIGRAANAMRKNDIETRCRELDHAALILGQLQDWVDVKNGGESAQTLIRFYSYLRAKFIEASATKSAPLLEAQIEMILHVRSSWQLLDVPTSSLAEAGKDVSTEMAASAYAPPSGADRDRIPFSQRA